MHWTSNFLYGKIYPGGAAVEFRWIEWNVDKVEKHGVSSEEAEFVVENVRRPYVGRV
jgi:hypothetical protein